MNKLTLYFPFVQAIWTFQQYCPVIKFAYSLTGLFPFCSTDLPLPFLAAQLKLLSATIGHFKDHFIHYVNSWSCRLYQTPSELSSATSVNFTVILPIVEIQ